MISKICPVFFAFFCFLSVHASAESFRPFPPQASWTASGEDAQSQFGFRACWAGDVRGKGYSDLIIGAPGYDHSRGKVYVYFGGPHGLPRKPDWTFEGEHPGDAFGDRVGSAGDVNGYGYGDIYVSASSWGKGRGKVYVFYGSARGLPPKPSWTAHEPGTPPLSFGDCTVPTGDLNGDGYDDLAVGAYGFDGTRGEVFVFYGSKRGLARKAGWRAEGAARGDQFGYGLGPAGDVNGDGFDDLVIASKYHTQSLLQQGEAYLYLGSARGLGKASWSVVGGSRAANLGTRVYGVGDLNGGGHPDVMISEPDAHGGRGEVLAYAGTAHGLAPKPFMKLEAPKGNLGFGYCLGPLGSMGPHREPCFFVSSRTHRGGVVDIYGYRRGGGALLLESIRAPLKSDRFGEWCAPAGDVNGDGAPDLCISDATSGPGHVYVYYGRASGVPGPTNAGRAYLLGGARR